FFLSLSTPGSPHFDAGIGNLIANISTPNANSVVLHLKRVHVRPESLLQTAIPIPASFGVADYSKSQVVLTAANASQARGPRAVIEQTFADDESAVAALRNGDIDVLDRVPPWQVARLREDNAIHLGTYKLPTVHVLIPNLKKPLLAKREFRRALCYGID